jgi:hypothetical protein
MISLGGTGAAPLWQHGTPSLLRVGLGRIPVLVWLCAFGYATIWDLRVARVPGQIAVSLLFVLYIVICATVLRWLSWRVSLWLRSSRPSCDHIKATSADDVTAAVIATLGTLYCVPDCCIHLSDTGARLSWLSLLMDPFASEFADEFARRVDADPKVVSDLLAMHRPATVAQLAECVGSALEGNGLS